MTLLRDEVDTEVVIGVETEEWAVAETVAMEIAVATGVTATVVTDFVRLVVSFYDFFWLFKNLWESVLHQQIKMFYIFIFN